MVYKKGESGNPGGRPSQYLDRKAIKALGPKAIEVLQDLMINGIEESVRLNAAKWLAEGAYGKAKQDVDISGSIESKNLFQVIVQSKLLPDKSNEVIDVTDATNTSDKTSS